MHKYDVKKIFGKNLKYYRFKKGLSQEQLAEHFDAMATYISNIETGRYGTNFEKIAVFCEILEIKPSQLFNEKILEENFDDRIDIYNKK